MRSTADLSGQIDESPRLPRYLCTNYGFWLPNDERGSGSDFIRADHLLKFGPANPVTHNRSVARKRFNYEIRQQSRSELKFPPVVLNGHQALSVAKGFRHELTTCGGTLWACAILPDHQHFVIAPHRYDIRRFIGRLRGAATKQLIADGRHPLIEHRDREGAVPSPWARLPWIVYLWTEEDVLQSIDYVERNPVRARLKRQSWNFVREYPERNPIDVSR